MPKQDHSLELVVFTTPNEYSRHHRGEYFVISNEGLTAKWRKDKSIPLVDVLQTFDIYERWGGGNDGEISHANTNRVNDVLHTDSDVDAIQRILEEGNIIPFPMDRLHGPVLGKQRSPPFRDNRSFKKSMVQSR